MSVLSLDVGKANDFVNDYYSSHGLVKPTFIILLRVPKIALDDAILGSGPLFLPTPVDAAIAYASADLME